MLTEAALERIHDHVHILERARYRMMMAFLDHGELDLKSICEKLEWSRFRVYRMMLTNCDLTPRPIAEWAWALGGEAEIKFRKRVTPSPPQPPSWRRTSPSPSRDRESYIHHPA